jgi:uncharacterized protein
VFSLLIGAVASWAWAAGPLPAKPDRYATDRTGRLDAARMARLNETLASFERETSTQILVYVDARLPPGTTLEEVAAAAMAEWGVGQKGKDNGALFLAFLDDRRMRIEVGYGLEGALPDARAHRIVTEVATPSFRRGDFTGGVEAAAGEMVKAARGEPFRGTGRTAAERPAPVLVAPNWVGWTVIGLFAMVPAVLLTIALRRSWIDAGKVVHPLARPVGRLGVLLWIAWVVVAPFALAWRSGPLPWLLLFLFMAAVVAGGVVAFGQKKGFARVRSLTARVALVVAAGTLPAVARGLAAGGPDVGIPLLVFVAALFVAVLCSVQGVAGSRGFSYSSSGSGWSRSSSSGGGFRSSSSSFSGGGGRSGGGGASGSW